MEGTLRIREMRNGSGISEHRKGYRVREERYLAKRKRDVSSGKEMRRCAETGIFFLSNSVHCKTKCSLSKMCKSCIAIKNKHKALQILKKIS